MGEGLGQAVADLFDIMTSGIGSFGKALLRDLAHTAALWRSVLRCRWQCRRATWYSTFYKITVVSPFLR